MSHKIIPFSRSNLLDIKDNKFLFIQDEHYIKNKFISYDFNLHELSEMIIPLPFSSVFNDYDGCIQIERKYKSFNNKEQANVAYESSWGENPIYEYENIDEYPELEIFLLKSQSHGSLRIYGDDGNYHLDVWHSQAYVISLNDKITAFHIDETYMLQEGDSHTFVWNFDDNFVVYNDGDVYSVVIIVENKDI